MVKITVHQPSGDDLLDVIAAMDPKQVQEYYTRVLQAMQARIQEV
jgi:hypothetical protein